MDIKSHKETILAGPKVETGDISSQIDSKDADLAAKFLLEVQGENFQPLTPEQERKLLHKLDRWMIPMCLFFATLGAVDKVEISTAALYGFRSDNHLVGQQYSWVGSIVSIGYIAGMFPSSYLATRFPTAKYMACCSLAWSIVTLMYAAVHNWAGIMVLRALMGALEAVISPGITLIMASFYKKREQPWRMAVVFGTWSSIINGFWSFVVGTMPDTAPLHKWQYLYLITGSINVLFSIFLIVALPDSPLNAFFLTKEEKYHAIVRLASNRTGVVNRTFKWWQVKEALLETRTWIIFFFNIAINIPNGGLITFGSIIINSLGFSDKTSALLTMPTGMMSNICGIGFAFIAARWKGRRCLTIAISALVPMLGTILVYALPRSNTSAQMAGLYLMYGYWGPYVTFVSLPQANIAGYTKKTITYCLLNIGYSVGNLIGPQTFRSDQAPAYTGGVIAMLCCYCICVLLALSYWVTAVWANRKRDRLYGASQTLNVSEETAEELAQAFQDHTDRQQKDFRYLT